MIGYAVVDDARLLDFLLGVGWSIPTAPRTELARLMALQVAVVSAKVSWKPDQEATARCISLSVGLHLARNR